MAIDKCVRLNCMLPRELRGELQRYLHESQLCPARGCVYWVPNEELRFADNCGWFGDGGEASNHPAVVAQVDEWFARMYPMTSKRRKGRWHKEQSLPIPAGKVPLLPRAGFLLLWCPCRVALTQLTGDEHCGHLEASLMRKVK